MDNLSSILASNHLTPGDISLVNSIAVTKNVKTHQTLINYGEKCQSIFFVLKGGFAMKVINEEIGEERTISFNLDCFQPFMTSPQSYFTDVPSSCRLQAITNSDVLVFKKTHLVELIETSGRIKDFYYRQIINALLMELDFRIKLITLSPQQMYELFISKYQELVRNVPSKDIASFIGISPEWLSNLKKKL